MGGGGGKGGVAAERKLAKKKAAQDKKIKSTIKRLRAPKARPLVDLVEGVSRFLFSVASRHSRFHHSTFSLSPELETDLSLTCGAALVAGFLAQKLPQDPYARAMHLLHVGATPETLPCREEQYADVLVKIEGVIEGGGGGCICELMSFLLSPLERRLRETRLSSPSRCPSLARLISQIDLTSLHFMTGSLLQTSRVNQEQEKQRPFTLSFEN